MDVHKLNLNMSIEKKTFTACFVQLEKKNNFN